MCLIQSLIFSADHLVKIYRVGENTIELSTKPLYEPQGDLKILLYTPNGFLKPSSSTANRFAFYMEDFPNWVVPIVEGTNVFGNRMKGSIPKVLDLRFLKEDLDVRILSDFKNRTPYIYVIIKASRDWKVERLLVCGEDRKFFRVNDEVISFFKSDLKDGIGDVVVELKGKYGIRVKLRKEIFVLKGVAVPLRGDVGIFKIVPIEPRYHIVQPGETLWSIAMEYNLRVGDLILINSLENPNLIMAGQKLKLGRVVFTDNPTTIVIDLSTSRLALYYDNILLKVYPVALGRSDATPPGKYWILRKEIDPALYWFGEYISPRSPINGLGTRYLQLSDPTYGIHGTSKPWEIGKRISHGCIRMFNPDVEELDAFAGVGTEVLVVRWGKEFPEILSDITKSGALARSR